MDSEGQNKECQGTDKGQITPQNFIIVDSHYFMNHKKLLNVALRVGKGSMGMQGITELFHPWA